MSDETKTEPKKEPELVPLNLNRMQVSPLAKKMWKIWAKRQMGSNAALFEDMLLSCMENGFKPSRIDRRGAR